LVSEQVSNFSIVAFTKAPEVSLVTKGALPDSGIIEIVASPEGNGLGLPVSLWSNANPVCDGLATVIPAAGSWISCTAEDWYGEAEAPDDVACPDGNCSCAASDALSNTLGLLPLIGTDVVIDPFFPCDLFEFYFGVAREQYEVVRDNMTVIDDCSSLDSNSFGTYWVTGPSCDIGANQVIGSVDNPVLLISAASVTNFASGSEFFGMLFVTDVEDDDATLNTQGDATVYGNVVVDGILGEFSGTYNVVYNDGLVADVSATGSLGAITGTWTDFHRKWR
jgi:hypothetical protein